MSRYFEPGIRSRAIFWIHLIDPVGRFHLKPLSPRAGKIIYHRSLVASFFILLENVVVWLIDAIIMLLVVLIWLLRWALVVAIPAGLYLASIAALWGLYRVAAGYFFPATWPIALRAPAFWPVVAGVTFLFAIYGLYRLIRPIRW